MIDREEVIGKRGRVSEVRIYESPMELAAHCRERQAADRARGRYWPWGFSEVEFIGRKIDGWDDLEKKAGEVWEFGVETTEKMITELRDVDMPQPASRKRRPCFREHDGDEVDNDRLRSGQAFWRTSHRPHVRGQQTVTIVCDLATSCKVNSRDIMWRGAAAVALTHVLEEAGYRVELWGASWGDDILSEGGGDVGVGTGVLIKRPQDPIDIANMANVTSGWWFRTAVFGSMCAGQRDRAIDYSLGMPMDVDPFVPFLTSDEKAVVVPRTLLTYQAAVEWLKKTLPVVADLQPISA